VSALLSMVPRPRRRITRHIPSESELIALPVAYAGEFELSEAEVKQTRRLIYSINKQGMFRYRTLREGTLLNVWRIK